MGKKYIQKKKRDYRAKPCRFKTTAWLRYCHMRGLENVQEQCLLTAVVQNMKKIARQLSHMFFDFLTKDLVVISNLYEILNAIAQLYVKKHSII